MGLLVPLLPVNEAFGVLACAHAAGPGEGGTGSASSAAHGHSHRADQDGAPADAHPGCTWLAPCSASSAALHTLDAAPSIHVAQARPAAAWAAAPAPRPSVLAFLRPPANAPPLLPG